MQSNDFSYHVDKFADIEVLRYPVPGFEQLPLSQKILIYHLSEAALCGRDILFDQNFKGNLAIRNALETIYLQYKGDRNTTLFKAFETYLKRVWFSSGIHHHYSTLKLKPEFTQAYWNELLDAINYPNEQRDTLSNWIFNPQVAAKRVNLDAQDIVQASANNYYSGVTQAEAEQYYAALRPANDPQPISYGLNSRLEKQTDGSLCERVWKADATYGQAISKIVEHLKNALPFACNKVQRQTIEKLIAYYQSGDLQQFDQYSILWAQDTLSDIDFVNGFIETYGDALGLKGSWESIVNFKDLQATKRTETISASAQWFEDHSPIDPRFKKQQVKGVSAKVITVAMLAGDCYPATPIGINLPNADWIRKEYGSKSVTIQNIMQAYSDAAKGNGFAEEFYPDSTTRQAWYRYGFETDVLHTDLHECLGHGSGQLLEGVSSEALKAYASTIEEARADLFGLYYMADNKIIELGLLPDSNAYQAAYYNYLLNGLMTQLVRIPMGEQIEEAHMRNRHLIAAWVFERGVSEGVCDWIRKEGKTFLQITNYQRLRQLFGTLLAEIQRIKSEGDYEAARQLVERYAIHPNPHLHQEVLERYQSLHLSPYKGFVNPVLRPLTDADGHIIDIEIDYLESYTDQMLRYSRDYHYLTEN